jgi:hypothetical protein
MSVIAVREVLPRTLTHEIEKDPRATIKYSLTVDAPVTHREALNSVGISHGSPHPDLPDIVCTEISIDEPDPYHVDITYTFDENPQPELEDEEPPDIEGLKWTFSVGGAEIPTLSYYEGAGNANVKELVNAAGDFFEGITIRECEIRASVEFPTQSFALGTASQFVNHVNSQPFLGGGPGQWLCTGITANSEPAPTGLVYRTSVEFVYRASGWNLILPDAGFNFIDPEDGQYKRARVFFDDGQEYRLVPSAGPVALEADGSMRSTGVRLLSRRVYPEADFRELFGN